MKLLQSDMSVVLPEEGLREHLEDQLTEMNRFGTFTPYTGQDFLLKMASLLRKGRDITPSIC